MPPAAAVGGPEPQLDLSPADPEYQLPGQYRSAIEESAKQFGPEATNAIHRKERRSEKLLRKHRQSISAAGVAGNAGDNGALLGAEPEQWKSSEAARRRKSSVFHS